MEYENWILKEVGQNKYITGYKWDISNPIASVCIIHGIGEYAGRYNRVAKKLNDSGFAVFSLDLKGHGRSYGKRGHCAPRLEILESIDLIVEFAKKIHGDFPIFVYGHSMGGNIALDYRNRGLLNSNVKGFVVSAPWIELVRHITFLQNIWIRFLSKVKPDHLISAAIKESDLGNSKNVGNYHKDKLNHGYISVLCAVDGWDIGKALVKGEHERNQNELTPMLLMHGDADAICDINGSKKISRLEGDLCEFVIWPDLFHEIHNGGIKSTGDEVIDKTIRWMKDQME